MDYKKRTGKYGEKLFEYINEFNDKVGLKDAWTNLHDGDVNTMLDKLGDEINTKIKNGEGNIKDIFKNAFKEFSSNLFEIATNLVISKSEGYYEKLAEHPQNFTKYLKHYNDLIKKIGVGYACEHDISTQYVESLGGIEDDEIVKKAGDIYKRGTTLKTLYESVLPTNKGEKFWTLVNHLNERKESIISFKANMNDDIYHSEYTKLIDNAKTMCDSPSRYIDSAKEDERAADLIQNMAITYNTLREEYHKQTFFHRWLTWAGWQESNLINKTRKEMINTIGFDNDKSFNEFAARISGKDSHFAHSLKESTNKMEKDFINERDHYVFSAKEQFKVLTDENGVIDIPNELVNEGAQNIIIEEKVDSKENPELINIKEN